MKHKQWIKLVNLFELNHELKLLDNNFLYFWKILIYKKKTNKLNKTI